MDGTIHVNGAQIGVDRDLYQDFHWQFGIPFELGARSTDPFRWASRRDEQSVRLREIVKVFGDEDTILVCSPLLPLCRWDFTVNKGSIAFHNAVGCAVCIMAAGHVILDDLETVTPGFPHGNARIMQWLRSLMLMDERSM